MNEKQIGMSLGEFLATESEEQIEWNKTRRIGCAEYVPETNVIWLYVYDGGGHYEIDLDRCTTSTELAEWLFHLAGKTWCKGSVLTDFIRCLDFAIPERHNKSAEEYFQVHGESKRD